MTLKIQKVEKSSIFFEKKICILLYEDVTHSQSILSLMNI